MAKLPIKEVISWQARLGSALTAEAGRQVVSRVTRKTGQVDNIDTRPFVSPYQRRRAGAIEAGRIFTRLASLSETSAITAEVVARNQLLDRDEELDSQSYIEEPLGPA